jgi:predicted metalloprotease with PDZ domain
LPYRFGLRGFDYLLGRLNAVLQAYGSSPRINMDIVDSQRSFYDDWYAELIPYMRGCVYLLQIDSSLRKASGIFGFDQMSPLDDIIVDMGQRWQRGERLQASDWLTYLWPYLGDMSQGFRAMLRGTTIDLKDVLVAHEDWILDTSMQEILEFGLDKSSTNTRIVSGLVQGSRAAIAGLKNGDKILSTSRASLCAMSLSATFEIYIERDCQKLQISYWPRSFTKARVFYLTYSPSEELRKCSRFSPS